MVGPRAAARGFTLIELLVAMTVFAMTALLVFDGLRLGTQSWQAVDAQSDRTEQMRLVAAFVRRQLDQAHAPMRGVTEEGVPIVDFTGTQDTLTWIAPFPGYLPEGGLYRFTVSRGEEREDATPLLLHYELYQTETWERFLDDDEAVKVLVLHEDVEQLELAYLDPRGLDGRAVWQSEWVERERLPALVRMRVVPRSEPRAWPDVIAAPRLSAHGGRP